MVNAHGRPSNVPAGAASSSPPSNVQAWQATTGFALANVPDLRSVAGRVTGIAAIVTGLDFELYEGGVLVGGTTGIGTLELYEGGVLVGDVASLTTLEMYEGGILVGSVP